GVHTIGMDLGSADNQCHKRRCTLVVQVLNINSARFDMRGSRRAHTLTKNATLPNGARWHWRCGPTVVLFPSEQVGHGLRVCIARMIQARKSESAFDRA